MKPVKMIIIISLLITFIATARAAESDQGAIRKEAQKAYQNGNWKDAFNLYRRLALDVDNDPEMVGADLTQAWYCLRSLNRLNELDDFREKAIAQHRDNWRLLLSAAGSYSQNNHWGFMVAGIFNRGSHRGGGKSVNAVQRDRVRALQLMHQALNLTSQEPDKAAAASFYLEFARILLQFRGQVQAWRLQYLTDLNELPDYEPGYGYGYGGNPLGAPVDAEGQPVFHKIPLSFETAISDGERWRWLLVNAARLDLNFAAQAKYEFASFLYQQFGVQTLAEYSHRLYRMASVVETESQTNAAGPYAVHTLTDNETIVKLAAGVRRIQLPDEFNYIKIFNELARTNNSGFADDAVRTLARIYENRRLYDRAAAYWEKYKPHNKSLARQRINQIVDNWGGFEGSGTQPAGRPPSVDYRFRNGRRVDFSAYRIRVESLLEDIKAYIRSDPRRLDWQKINLNNIGWRLVTNNETKYIGEKVAVWSMKLQPDNRRWDRRVTVKAPEPLARAGAYLLIGSMQNGNTSRIIVWVDDTVIVKKPLDRKTLYYLADAVNGQPLPGARVEFFGYRTQRTKGIKKYRVQHKSLNRQTDDNGLVILKPSELDPNLAWLTTATVDGKFRAYLGFSRVWYGNYDDRDYNQTKTFIMTDRPVYRPRQKVKFKAWVRHARYDLPDTSAFAGKKFTVTIHNPRNEQVYTATITADEYGGLAGEYLIPDDAPLGVYRISHGPGSVYGGQTFRVEEYKKPEFEVTVAAPGEPVMLGETIEAVIKARYYFGSPVSAATVKYKVLRNEHDSRWYPAFTWDWFYGPGYWWYAYDYPWYPGWLRWGCIQPRWTWWPGWPRRKPEVVAEGELKIGSDGTVKLKIDTALAKLIHADRDHRYTISAEVRDRSRRTIVGQGQVLVARRPFKVYAWVDRGHYRVGDTIQAGFKAQTLDQKPVSGPGLLKLLRVDYIDAKPVETEVRKWDLDTDAQGQAKIKIQASQAGQYRLSYRVTDKKNHTIEGGYIFNIRGEGSDGADYRYAKIELIPDKRDYAPGDTIRLLINTDRKGAAVILFVRPTNGIYRTPQVIHMNTKSTVQTLAVSKKDMPNFFIEALTVFDGKVHSQMREIVVPPEKRVLNVNVTPSRAEYRPGQPAKVKIKVTDLNGEPFQGTAAVTVYDRAVEYISGGSNIPEIRSFFWKWRRRHQPRTESNLTRWFSNLVKKKEVSMQNIGIFGHLVPQTENARGSGADPAKPTPSAASDAGNAFRSKKKTLGRALASQSETVVTEEKMASRQEQDADAEPLPSDMPVQPGIRKQFADTAFWNGAIHTDITGTAEIDFSMPENLTDWKIIVWALGHGTKVGHGTASVVTRKNIILRMQAPRFFTETDEVVLSANVHNYLKKAESVRVQLEMDGDCLALTAGEKQQKTVTIEPNGERRVDWRVLVRKEGQAVIRMLALTNQESDAMQMQFPVYVHGMVKQVPKSGVIRPDESGSAISFEVPAARRVDESRLELRYSPTLAGAMLDALPYLTGYPYGCTEQTLNRFLPTVITQGVLQKMGVNPAEINTKQTNLNARELGGSRDRAAQWHRYRHNPVFDETTVAAMVAKGIQRLADMQLSNGGWGWFSGYGERAYPHTTAYVLHGLQRARQNKIKLPDGMLERGIRWLQSYQAKEIKALQRRDNKKDDGKPHADNLDAFVYMVLVDAELDSRTMRDYLYRDRNLLAVYAKAMFGLALHKLEDQIKLTMIVKNIEQYLVQDGENQTAYLNLPNRNYWWFWYGSEYEAHAYYLKLLVRTDPAGTKAPALVKYLLNNRKHSTYWNSTRDTAVVVEALADYLAASDEIRPDMTVDIYFDGQKMKTVTINRYNLFNFDNAFILEGRQISTGSHTIELKKSGKGPLYFNAYLDYFTLEDFITREGLEIKVQRNVFRLVDVDKSVKDVGSHGQVVDRRVEKLDRIPLENLASVKSGDLIEVELVIDSKNDYEYLVFEDMKAAGFEPVEVRSGYNGNDMGAYVEFRDRNVNFFVHHLARGRHSVSYRLRAEIPGKFSALPTRAYAMYAPELKANSDEIKLFILDE